MSYEQREEMKMDMGGISLAILKSSIRIIIVTAILLVATYFILQIVPKKYISSASILVETRASIFTRASGDNSFSQSGVLDPTIIKSHVALIKSRDIISRVVESENLINVDELNGNRSSSLIRIMRLFRGEPSSQSLQERVIFAVAKRTRVVQLPESSVITINFKSLDPELSARVANAIANSHVSRRSELSVSDTSEATKWLLAQIEEMRTLVAKAEAKIATYRVDNDLFSGTNNTSILDQQLTNISTQITAAQERGNLAQSRAELIRGLMNNSSSLDGVPDVRNSVVVQRLAQDKARLQGERAQLLATRLPDHPDIKSITAQIAEINKQIRREGVQVANSLEAQAKIEKNLEQSLRDDLVRLKIDVSGATKSSVILGELEREAKVQRDLLATYLSRYRDAAARSETSAVLPDVRVITNAAPALTPASPKKALILFAVGFLSVFLQFGAVLFREILSSYSVKQVDYYQEISSDGSLQNSGEYMNETSEPSPPLVKETSNIPMNTNNQNNDNFSEVRKIPTIRASNFFKDIISLNDYVMNSNVPIFITSIGIDIANNHNIIRSISSELRLRSKSIVEVDAGSRNISAEQGITDLCKNGVEYGDVVQRNSQSNSAFVSWGQHANFDFQSKNSKILVSALSEIFEIVLVDVGKSGMASSLSAFVGQAGEVLVIVGEDADYAQINSLSDDVLLMGFTGFSVLKTSISQTKVA